MDFKNVVKLKLQASLCALKYLPDWKSRVITQVMSR